MISLRLNILINSLNDKLLRLSLEKIIKIDKIKIITSTLTRL